MRTALSCIVLLVWQVPASGHDLWVVPLTPTVQPGEPVTVQLAVGMDFPMSTHAADPARVKAVLLDPRGNRTAIGEWSRDEAGQVTQARVSATTEGLHLVCVQTVPNKIELKAQEFNLYLLHDGMPLVLAQRFSDGQADRDAVEQYSKYAKAVFRVGTAGQHDARIVTQPAGQKLEIVPLTDPTAARPGATLAVRVLFDGSPLAKANVCWDLPGTGEGFVGSVLTDERGEAVVPISRAGPMTLRLTHMTRPQTAEYEWESFWASLTFHVSGG